MNFRAVIDCILRHMSDSLVSGRCARCLFSASKMEWDFEMCWGVSHSESFKVFIKVFFTLKFFIFFVFRDVPGI